MVEIATCPLCASEQIAPELATGPAPLRVECAVCRGSFDLAVARRRKLPVAVAKPAPAKPAPVSATEAKSLESLTASPNSTASPSLSAPPSPTPSPSAARADSPLDPQRTLSAAEMLSAFFRPPTEPAIQPPAQAATKTELKSQTEANGKPVGPSAPEAAHGPKEPEAFGFQLRAPALKGLDRDNLDDADFGLDRQAPASPPASKQPQPQAKPLPKAEPAELFEEFSWQETKLQSGQVSETGRTDRREVEKPSAGRGGSTTAAQELPNLLGDSLEEDFDSDEYQVDGTDRFDAVSEAPSDFSAPEYEADTDPDYYAQETRQPLRRRSIAARFTSVAASLAFGLTLGYTALVWLRGPAGDFLGVLPAMSGLAPASVAEKPERAPRKTQLAASGGAAVTDDVGLAGEANPTPRLQADPGVVPATFEAPITEGDNPSLEATSPNQSSLSESPSRGAPHPSGPIRLLGAPRYSIADLEVTLGSADAAANLLCDCSYTDAANRAEIGRSYAELCRVAQTLAFIDPEESDDPDFKVMQAQDLFRRVFSSEHARADSQHIAARWLSWTGRPHGGVFFAATPVTMDRAGSVYAYTFLLTDADTGEETEVVTLTAERHDPDRFARGDAKVMGVVGCVVEKPAELIEGYTGTAQRAVWIAHANDAIPLGEARLP